VSEICPVKVVSAQAPSLSPEPRKSMRSEAMPSVAEDCAPCVRYIFSSGSRHRQFVARVGEAVEHQHRREGFCTDARQRQRTDNRLTLTLKRDDRLVHAGSRRRRMRARHRRARAEEQCYGKEDRESADCFHHIAPRSPCPTGNKGPSGIGFSHEHLFIRR
jgi:hypothetical protein